MFVCICVCVRSSIWYLGLSLEPKTLIKTSEESCKWGLTFSSRCLQHDVLLCVCVCGFAEEWLQPIVLQNFKFLKSQMMMHLCSELTLALV